MKGRGQRREGRGQKSEDRSQKPIRTGLTEKVREAARRLSTDKQSLSMPPEFTAAELKAALDVRTYRECRTAAAYVIKELRKQGEIENVARGVYRYTPKQRPRTKLDVIWHLVRSHRQFGTDEMERLSGAARITVVEYLRCLTKLGYLRQVRRGHWQMVKDPGPETPVNAGKCDRLRRMRRRKE